MKEQKAWMGTEEMGKAAGVAARTVAKWVDTGLLPAIRLPGTRRRRVLRTEFEKFLKEHGFVPNEEPQA